MNIYTWRFSEGHGGGTLSPILCYIQLKIEIENYLGAMKFQIDEKIQYKT